MIDNKHTIGTLHFDLETYNEKHAQEIQKSVSGIGKREIPDIMEESLNRVGMNDSVSIIDKLEINLGEIPYEDFQTNFLAVFDEQFNEKLAELHFDDIAEKKVKTKMYDKVRSDSETLKFFLLTGRLPWYIESTSPDLKLILKKLTDAGSEEFIQFVKKNISDDEFLERIIYQFPEPIVIHLFKTIFKQNIEEYLHFAEQLLSVFLKSEFVSIELAYPEHVLLKISVETLNELADQPTTEIMAQIMIKLARILGVDDKELSSKLSELIIEMKMEPAIEIPNGFEAKVKDLIIIPADIADEIVATKTSEELDEQESYYISNAGLVLLHLYLPELFRKTILIKNSKFIDEKMIHTAIHLLQYAVYGNKARPEHLLMLNKILCGYPLEKPIPLKIDLIRQNKIETTKMVSAAIKNWAVLKNTSVKGFREAFLQRQGLLKRKENGWRLMVERKSHDVLLDRIPWNYKIIKLPWMEEIIEVEW